MLYDSPRITHLRWNDSDTVTVGCHQLVAELFKTETVAENSEVQTYKSGPGGYCLRCVVDHDNTRIKENRDDLARFLAKHNERVADSIDREME